MKSFKDFFVGLLSSPSLDHYDTQNAVAVADGNSPHQQRPLRASGVVGIEDAIPMITPRATAPPHAFAKRDSSYGLIGYTFNGTNYDAQYCLSNEYFTSSSTFGGCCSSGETCTEFYTFCKDSTIFNSASAVCTGGQNCYTQIVLASLGATNTVDWMGCIRTPRTFYIAEPTVQPNGSPLAAVSVSTSIISGSTVTQIPSPSSAVASTSVPSSLPIAPTPAPSPSHAGAIAGGVVGGVVGLLVLVAALIFFLRRRRLQKQRASGPAAVVGNSPNTKPPGMMYTEEHQPTVDYKYGGAEYAPMLPADGQAGYVQSQPLEMPATQHPGPAEMPAGHAALVHEMGTN